MGMDLHIFRSPTVKAIENDDPNVISVFYGRRAWHYPEHCSFIPHNYKSGEYIPLTRKNIKEMIKVACKYRNYWDTYSDVPELCEIRDNMKEWKKDGYNLYLEYDW